MGDRRESVAKIQSTEITARFKDGFMLSGFISGTTAGTRHSHLAVAANLTEQSTVLPVGTLGKKGLPDDKAIAE